MDERYSRSSEVLVHIAVVDGNIAEEHAHGYGTDIVAAPARAMEKGKVTCQPNERTGQ